MVNPAPPAAGTSWWSTDSTTASGGASAAIRSQNRATAAGRALDLGDDALTGVGRHARPGPSPVARV